MFSAAIVPSVCAQAAKRIDSIRAEVGLINKSADKYRKKTKTLDDISLEGTEAAYFTSASGLRKITAKIYGETYRATAEFFFSSGELIFAYQKLDRYDTHIAMNPPPKVVRTIETRVYFAGVKAVRVLDGNTEVSSSAPGFAEAEGDMKELAEKLKNAYLN